MIIVCQRLFKNTKINAITIFPFIILGNKHFRRDSTLIHHERIHLCQQLEMLVIPFYIWYVAEFFIHYIRLKDSYAAYRAISFEKETYEQEENTTYLEQRKFWEFTRYL